MQIAMSCNPFYTLVQLAGSKGVTGLANDSRMRKSDANWLMTSMAEKMALSTPVGKVPMGGVSLIVADLLHVLDRRPSCEAVGLFVAFFCGDPTGVPVGSPLKHLPGPMGEQIL